jgi:hypothetical protein
MDGTQKEGGERERETPKKKPPTHPIGQNTNLGSRKNERISNGDRNDIGKLRRLQIPGGVVQHITQTHHPV